MLREVPIYLGGCTEGLVIINNAEGSADLPWWDARRGLVIINNAEGKCRSTLADARRVW